MCRAGVGGRQGHRENKVMWRKSLHEEKLKWKNLTCRKTLMHREKPVGNIKSCVIKLTWGKKRVGRNLVGVGGGNLTCTLCSLSDPLVK